MLKVWSIQRRMDVEYCSPSPGYGSRSDTGATAAVQLAICPSSCPSLCAGRRARTVICCASPCDSRTEGGAGWRVLYGGAAGAHGCDGSATQALRVRIPDGYLNVKPMPKPGWKLEVKRGTYAKPASLGDAKVSEGVTEVDWSGGNLPDAYYNEFVLTGTIGNIPAGQMMYFPVVQECEKGVQRWIEIPAANSVASRRSRRQRSSCCVNGVIGGKNSGSSVTRSVRKPAVWRGFSAAE
jgi:hypothetical protein